MDLTLSSRLTEEEVIGIAQKIGREEDWLSDFVQNNPTLEKVGKKLLWKVNFTSKEETDVIMLGQHKFITI